MPALERILRGILTYNKNIRPQMVEAFKRAADSPEPKAIMFTCMDTRLLTNHLLQNEPGELFVIRNAGNLMPHATHANRHCISTEPGALEFGVLQNKARHVFVCGHSDCKAMNALEKMDRQDVDPNSSLELWLRRHGSASLAKFDQHQAMGSSHPLIFQLAHKEISAYIDPDDELLPVDKLSQVNTLQQLHNIASHPFMKERYLKGDVHLCALWFDVTFGQFFIFSQEQGQFIKINDESILDATKEVAL